MSAETDTLHSHCGGDISGSVTTTTIVSKAPPEVQTGNGDDRISKYHYMRLFLLYISIL